MAWLFILAFVAVVALTAGVTYFLTSSSIEKEVSENALRAERQHQFELKEKTSKAAKDAVANLKPSDLAKILDEIDDSNEDFYTYVAFMILEYQDLLEAKKEGKGAEELNHELLEVYDALYHVILSADDAVEGEASIKVKTMKMSD